MIRIAFERYRDLGLLIARLGLGLGFFWFHGLPKLRGGREAWEGTGGAMSRFGIDFAPEWWGFAAAVAEGVGGLLIAAGFLFRPACLAVLFVMIVAATGHFATGRGTPAHAFKNAWVLAGLFLIGPGRYSVDHLLRRREAGADSGRQTSAAPKTRS